MCASFVLHAWAGAIARRSARSVMSRHSRQRSIPCRSVGKGKAARACVEARRRFCRLSKGRRLRAAEKLFDRQTHARRTDQDRERCRTARPRRRGFSDRPQMGARACGACAAHVCGQRRRRRARHVQGSLLSRARSAPFHRRRVDRRLGGRGARDLYLHPRRIPRASADACRRDRQDRKRGVCRRIPSCICGAARARISAAKNPR